MDLCSGDYSIMRMEIRLWDWVPLQGIFLTQGWNLSLLLLLNWQVGSLLLCHLGSSKVCMASCKVIPFIGKNVLKMGPEKPVLCMERSEPSGSLDSYENSKQTNKQKKKQRNIDRNLDQIRVCSFSPHVKMVNVKTLDEVKTMCKCWVL